MDKKYQKVLDFITKFGTVHERHLNLLFIQDERYAVENPQSILKTLVKEQYINQHKIKLDSIGSYYTLGLIGAEELNSKEVKDLNHNNLNHDMLLLDLYFDLLAKNPSAEIKSERELKIGEGLRIGDKKKYPDLMLYDGDKYIAIELEISVKSQDRLIEIINNYIQDSNLFAVHYFVKSQALGQKLLNLAGNHKKLKVFLLDVDANSISYGEILSKPAEDKNAKTESPWHFDLDYYLTFPEEYRK